VGGYDDWLRQRSEVAPQVSGERRAAVAPVAVSTDARRRRLTYKEQQEFTGLPAAIEAIEKEIAELHQEMSLPQFYQQPGEQIAQSQRHLKDLEERLAKSYQRWDELGELA
jgi:ABC transport system ATP-binding/permease protein